MVIRSTFRLCYKFALVTLFVCIHTFFFFCKFFFFFFFSKKKKINTKKLSLSFDTDHRRVDWFLSHFIIISSLKKKFLFAYLFLITLKTTEKKCPNTHAPNTFFLCLFLLLWYVCVLCVCRIFFFFSWLHFKFNNI